MAILSDALREKLTKAGVEYFVANGFALPDRASFEPPCGPKWIAIGHEFEMGAFSYAVSGFFSEVRIGRYCSFGENVQVGRGAHPTDWLSTSPVFYAYQGNMLEVGHDFDGAAEYHAFRPGPPGDIAVRNARTVNDFLAKTTIGHDVWIGHGAFLAQGITVGNGAVIAGAAVVTKDVPPYAIVGGNPAQVLRMRFSFAQCAALERLAWWRFAPWQINTIPFANIDRAITQLEERLPGLTPYEPARVHIGTLASQTAE
ncbi:CatB-related O-acetyltransferase [Acidisoma silvae]|nr:CatB-related O-acetyltransferase [Acidisoma silvae]